MTDYIGAATERLAAQYLSLTREEMPRLARGSRRHWPVRDDHCFQRIVLDTVCGGVWYGHLARPAYKNLSYDQAQRAVDLCHAIIDGTADLTRLNAQSLAWRGKASRPTPRRDLS